MKKIMLFVLLVTVVLSSLAQNPPFPAPQPQKPAPENLRPLGPPDLRVEELSLVSVIRDGAVKKINIQVLVRIKNTGELRSNASTTLAYMKIPAGSSTIRTLATSFATPAINPGASFVKVFTFREAESLFRPGTFEFWLKADARNVVRESNETNNTSVTLTIETPPVR